MKQTLRERARALLGLANAATEGPWVEDDKDTPWDVGGYETSVETRGALSGMTIADVADSDDALFIASSRTESPYLAQKLIEALDLLEDAHHRHPLGWEQRVGDFLREGCDR